MLNLSCDIANLRLQLYRLLRSLVFCALSGSLLSSCSEQVATADQQAAGQGSPGDSTAAEAGESTSTRWYTASQVAVGRGVFADNCAVCHGVEAQGTVADWRARLADGKFPPPPLNGSAHAWHHPLSVLLQQIDNGGLDLGGSMPPFADVLDDDAKLAAIAYFQSFWSDEIYMQWNRMNEAR